MLRILEDMAALGLDYLVVGPTSLQLNEPGLQTVAAAGTKLLMTDYTRPEEGVPYDDAVLNWVVYSHSEMGFKSGEWLGDELRARGKIEPKIVVLWGPAASEISEQRGQGALKGLGSHADLKPEIVYEAHADFNRQKAYDETERALAAYDFDAVIGLNSYMAVSAKNAVQAAGKLADIVIVGMGGTIDAVVRQLSGGQRQATAIARFLLNESGRLIIMDEPTAALGVKEQRRVLELIGSLKEHGVAMLIVSHNLDHVFDVCERVVVLRVGRVAGTVLTSQSEKGDVVGLIMGDAP